MTAQQHKSNAHQHDYMGVIVMNHYQADEPVTFPGLQRPSLSISEFALYQASVCAETGDVKKEHLIASWKLSDLQWGILIGRPNYGEGIPVLLHTVLGMQVQKDPSVMPVDVLKKRAQVVMSEDTQLTTFLARIDAALVNATARGKANKQELHEMAHLLNLFEQYLSDNESFHLSQALSSARKRVNEVLHDVVQWRQQLKNPTSPPLALPAPQACADAEVIGDLGMMQINIGGSGSNRLFNDVNEHGHVSLDLSTAEHQINRSGESYYKSVRDLYRVNLSPLQYSRLVRADSAEVPCTLARRLGVGSPDVEVRFTLEQHVESALQDNPVDVAEEAALRAHIANALEQLHQDKGRNKTVLAGLADVFTAIKSAYSAYVEASKSAKKAQLEQLLDGQQTWLKREIDAQIALLPPEQQASAQKHVQASLPDLNRD